ncbi:glycerophosphodiester phosphodiesterase family protein [Sphingomonas montana]|uniref:glycerophosphodiester phosphodiesterase family protein n=1 Tax=Sphingomonas montana TaxID=1843236 RepID=UPI00096DE527|nr:glycerophosphodiester phosphodiesterase family protein [Sphingomonas montana]
MPVPDPARTAFLRAQPFAHRGLHGDGRIENSRAAFAAAIAAGYGIECDVQASLDGEAFVFHDTDLDRLTDRSGPLAARTAAVLDGIRLSGSAEPIPTLFQLLARTLGRVPVLIEVKTPASDILPICRAVARELDGYRGPVAVMSFHPGVPRWFRRNVPAIVRGLVVTEEGRRGPAHDIRRALALAHARPDFLAYDIRSLPSPFAARARARGMPVLTWTVRDAAAERTAAAYADEVIFEGVHR